MSLSDPGYRDVDASLLRDIQLHDRLKFELRGEANNVFNLTNLGAPTAAMHRRTLGKSPAAAAADRVHSGRRSDPFSNFSQLAQERAALICRSLCLEPIHRR